MGLNCTLYSSYTLQHRTLPGANSYRRDLIHLLCSDWSKRLLNFLRTPMGVLTPCTCAWLRQSLVPQWEDQDLLAHMSAKLPSNISLSPEFSQMRIMRLEGGGAKHLGWAKCVLKFGWKRRSSLSFDRIKNVRKFVSPIYFNKQYWAKLFILFLHISIDFYRAVIFSQNNKAYSCLQVWVWHRILYTILKS